jgi:hypothetical protein
MFKKMRTKRLEVLRTQINTLRNEYIESRHQIDVVEYNESIESKFRKIVDNLVNKFVGLKATYNTSHQGLDHEDDIIVNITFHEHAFELHLRKTESRPYHSGDVDESDTVNDPFNLGQNINGVHILLDECNKLVNKLDDEHIKYLNGSSKLIYSRITFISNKCHLHSSRCSIDDGFDEFITDVNNYFNKIIRIIKYSEQIDTSYSFITAKLNINDHVPDCYHMDDFYHIRCTYSTLSHLMTRKADLGRKFIIDASSNDEIIKSINKEISKIDEYLEWERHMLNCDLGSEIVIGEIDDSLTTYYADVSYKPQFSKNGLAYVDVFTKALNIIPLDGKQISITSPEAFGKPEDIKLLN